MNTGEFSLVYESSPPPKNSDLLGCWLAGGANNIHRLMSLMVKLQS